MAVRARHSKTSGVADSGDTNLVQPSDWNADHPITADGPGIVGRTAAGAGAVSELAAADVRTFLEVAPQTGGTVTGQFSRWNQTTGRYEAFDLLGTANTWGALQTFTGQIDVTGSLNVNFRELSVTGVANQNLGGINAFGWDGAAGATGATINFRAAESWSGTQAGADIQFRAVNYGTRTLLERFRIRGNGEVVPGSDNAQSLGTAALRWANGHFGALTLNGAAGTGRLSVIQSGGVARWSFGGGSTAESGSNAGTPFIINRFDDAGAFLGQAVTIERSTGNFGLNQSSPQRRLHLVGIDGSGGAVPTSVGARHEVIYENNGNANFSIVIPSTASAGYLFNRYGGTANVGMTYFSATNILRVTGAGLSAALDLEGTSVTINSNIAWNAGNCAQVIPGTVTGQVALWNQTAGRYEPGSAPAAGAGGSNTQVQYNNAGVLAGATNVAIENNRLFHTDYEEFALLSAAAATPSAGRGRIYMRQRAGRVTLETLGPSGVDNAVQPAIFNNRVMLILPNTTTSVTAQGINATTAATLSHPALATTSLAASIYRTRCATSTTAGNAAGIRHAVATMARGNASFVGGFYFHARVCSGNIGLAGGQAFVGLSSSVAALAGEPSALADCVGLCKDTADTAWQFVRRTGTGTVQKVALTTPLTYAANQVIDVIVFSAPSGTGLGCVVRSFSNTGVPTTHLDTTYTDNLPAVTTLLAGRFDIRNGATAAAADFDLVRMYAESDF